MKINQIILENSHPLYESVLPSYHYHVILGEEIARVLNEVALTPDQIDKIFAQIQSQATASGGNRTAIGKGVDAASTVAKAYAGLKELAQNSGPVKGFDAAFDKIAAELKQRTGGDQGAMKYIQKYRDFAKAHPVAQKVVYGALVMAVGVASAGALGPAGLALKPAVIGLMRATDKLLQGEKFSSAAISGAETFAAGKVAQWAGQSIRNVMGGGNAVDAAADTATSGKLTLRGAVDQMREKFMSGEIKDYPSYQRALDDVLSKGSISGQSSIDRSRITFNLEKATGISFRGQYPDAVSPEGAKLLKQAGLPDMTGPNAQAPYDASRRLAAGGADAATSGLSFGQMSREGVKQLKDMVATGKITDMESYQKALRTILRNVGADATNYSAVKTQIDNIASGEVAQALGGRFTGNQADVVRKFIELNGGTPTAATRPQINFDKVDLTIPALTESQIKDVFRKIEEGPIDAIKNAAAAIKGSAAGQAVGSAVSRAASAVGQKIATGAQNLTTKVTADKLNRAWRAAGSPTDSDEIYQFLRTQGVDKSVIDAVFKSTGITEPTTPEFTKVSNMINQLDFAERSQLLQYLKTQLAI